MNNKFNKGMTAIAVVGTTSGTVAAGVIFVLGLLGPQIDDVAQKQYDDHAILMSMQAAVAQIPIMREQLTQAQIDAAKNYQLLHDLAQDRFQYNPRPSEIKAEIKAAQVIASSTP